MSRISFQEFYQKVGENERVMVDILRDLVMETEPNFEEKISYGVPYYFYHSRVCFIWPSGVKWGPKEGVLFGFCKGAFLDDFENILDTEGRKEIGTITFFDPKEIQVSKIKELLFQAIILDQDRSKKKRK
mgnify:CR=1 FL=1